MKQIFRAIAAWIVNADAGELNAVIFTAGMMLCASLLCLAIAIHGFPK